MQHVDAAVGRVRLRRWGDRGPVLFLMHGNGHSSHEWATLSGHLAGDHTLIAWDLPGQGDSVPLSRHLSIEEYGDAVVDVLDALDLEDVVLVGSSVGGCIAAAVGARGCGRVSGLVFVETNFRDPVWWEESWSFIESLFAVPTQTFEEVAPRYTTLTEEVWQRHNVDRNKAGGAAMFSVMWAIREFDIAAAVRAIELPSLLVFGTEGPTIGAQSEFEAAIPHAETAVLTSSGHFPMTDEPDVLAGHLRRFARRALG